MTTSNPCPALPLTDLGSVKGLYVHVPLCRRRCGYCDFFSEVLDPSRVPALVGALLTELEGYADGSPPRGDRAPYRPRDPNRDREGAAQRPTARLCADPPVAADGPLADGQPRAAVPRDGLGGPALQHPAIALDTIFVGGGTPTVLPPTELDRLLRGLRRWVAATGPVEFTVEANPATVTDEVAAVLAGAGVNRVSIGVQSFDPAELHVLERLHEPDDVGRTVATCRRHGLRHISLDLIFGIPGQTPASWRASLEAAVALEPEHLSCYGLTYEPGTPLRQRRDAGLVQPLDPDLEADLYEMAMDVLPAAGLHQYEISNFARRSAECRHNLRYWHNEPVLGIGPAAAGYIDDVRYKNMADTAGYVRAIRAGQSPRCEQERLPHERRARETAMLALRLTAGIDRSAFQRRFGDDPAVLFADAIARHGGDGLLAVDESGIRLTRTGRLVADTVMADFL